MENTVITFVFGTFIGATVILMVNAVMGVIKAKKKIQTIENTLDSLEESLVGISHSVDAVENKVHREMRDMENAISLRIDSLCEQLDQLKSHVDRRIDKSVDILNTKIDIVHKESELKQLNS